MNKLKYSFLAKTLAFFLFVIVLITSFGGTLCTIYLFSEGYFDEGRNFYNSRLCSDKANEYFGPAYVYFDSLHLSEAATQAEKQAAIQSMKYEFPPENSNYLFTISDVSGNVIFSNYSEQNNGYKMTRQNIYANSKVVYTFDGYIRNPITVQDDLSTNKQIFDTFYSLRYAIVIISAVSVVLSLVLAVWLISSVGYKKGREGITLGGFGLLPLDLFAAGIIFALIMLAQIPIRRPFSTNISEELTSFVIAASIASILVFSFLMSFAARCKAGKWWQNTIIYRVLKLVARFGKFLTLVFSHFSLLWKTILLYGSYIFINGILILTFVFGMGSGKAIPFFLGMIFNFIVLTVLLAFVLHMQSLKKAGEKLADGDYDYQIDTKNMRWDFKTHGDNLNHIGQGMSKAVDARMKSERFKTELITNVSHDIKTPLTSIVNYIDLLKKEDITDEKILAYIDVLDRQTARLQKLTEDLVEASKASTGNVAVVPVRTDLVEFLQQSVGEYSERFAANQIEAVIRKEEESAIVLADGRLLWRVFDNLLGNICKYSQPGTRVYADISKNAGKVAITIKNISRYPLNITSDELMERFVRGDISRSTEGSGLGLSIAKSLTELQNGNFRISIDGDLFKVMISFDSVK